MEKTREEIIKEIWNDIYKRFVPGFYWDNHDFMKCWYNPKTNSIESDCGISIQIHIMNENLNKRNIKTLIKDLRDKIYNEYLNIGIDLGYLD